MLSDNDSAAEGFINEVKNRGVTPEKMNELVRQLPLEGVDLEMFLIKSGFVNEYVQILEEQNISLTKSQGEVGFEDEIASKIRDHKITNMHALIEKLNTANINADRIPQFFTKAITDISEKVI